MIIFVALRGKIPPVPLVACLVVAFSSRARSWGECSAIHFQPALFFFFLS